MALVWATLAEEISAWGRVGLAALGAVAGAAMGARLVSTMGSGRLGSAFIALMTLLFAGLAGASLATLVA